MATDTVRYPASTTPNELLHRTTFGVLVAVLGVLLAQGVVDLLALDVGTTGANSPFSAIPLVGSVVAAGAGAAVVYAGLVRFTERPTRNFLVVAAAVFAAMLVPVAVAAPGLGVTATGQAVLVVYHVVVAVPLVAFVTGAVRP
jgi:hypothetical protein